MIKFGRAFASNGSSAREVPVPPASLAANAFAVTHYADAFRVRLDDRETTDVDALVSRLSASTPAWVDVLMAIRNAIVSTIGLRTARPDRVPGKRPTLRRYEPGDLAGMFRVYARTADEILMGGDDRHLNFRASMLVQREPDATYAVFTTVVHYNNWLGRAYFLPVRPFHRLIGPALLRRMHAGLAAARARTHEPA